MVGYKMVEKFNSEDLKNDLEIIHLKVPGRKKELVARIF